MWPVFPASDYYGPSVPLRDRQPTADLPVAALAGRRRGRARRGSHVHHESIDGMGVQLFRCSLASGTPQAFPDGPLTDYTVGFGVASLWT